MTLRQLQIFAEVAACGKMSTAAANLYVSQPTISETIAEIERYYDVKLFERYPKRLYLTAAGEVFLDETLKILEDYIHLDAVMQERLGGYPVRIAATAMAGHAVVIYHLPHHEPVHQISIIPRGQTGGMTISLPDEDRGYYAKSYMEEQIVSLMGGRVAEQLMLGDISTGASNDIQRATSIARNMVTVYGMSEKLGAINYQADSDEVFIGRSMGHTRPYSEEVAAQIDREVKAIIDESYQRSRKILEGSREKLQAVAEYLLQNETMDADTFRSFMEGQEAEEAASVESPADPEKN